MVWYTIDAAVRPAGAIFKMSCSKTMCGMRCSKRPWCR